MAAEKDGNRSRRVTKVEITLLVGQIINRRSDKCAKSLLPGH